MVFSKYSDSLDRARQKANNYSSSDDCSINQIKKNSYTSSKKQLQKAIISDFESECNLDVGSVIPKPPKLTHNVAQSVNKTLNTLNSSVGNIVDLDIIEGTLVSHKSNSLV